MGFDTSKIVGFDWDKWNLEHIKKHNVNYQECEEIFLNKPLLISKDEKHSEAEKRFKALGVTNRNRLIFLSFTIRDSKIRVITARTQNKKERIKFYPIGGERDK